MNTVSSKKFDVIMSNELIETFSKFSHDYNPLHLDKQYARRTPYGQPICYGGLVVIALLAKLHELHKLHKLGNILVQTLRADFIDAVFIDQLYQGSIELVEANRAELSLQQSGKVLLHCEVSYQVTNSSNSIAPVIIDESGGRPTGFLEEASQIKFSDLCKGKESIVHYQPNWSSAHKIWRLLDISEPFSLFSLSSLLALSSYWVGMCVPGRQALFSSVDITISQDQLISSADPVNVQATHVDEKFSLVQQQLVVGNCEQPWAKINVDAFFRDAPRTTDVVWLMKNQSLLPKLMQGKTVLVVGASRGLGASIAAAAALAGAYVFANYRKSVAPLSELEDSLPDQVRARFMSCPGDCTDIGSMNKIGERLKSSQRKIDYAFFCAIPPLQTMDPDLVANKAFSDYLADSIAMTSTPLAAFQQCFSDAAKMIYISSQAVNHVRQDWPHYTAAKASLESLWQALALKHAKKQWFNIRPPQLATDLVSSFIGSDPVLTPEQAALDILYFIEKYPPPSRKVIAMNDFSSPIPTSKRQSVGKDAGGESFENNTGTVRENYLAIAASFTLDPLDGKLEFWLEKLVGVVGDNVLVKYRLAPYNQIVQTLSLPNSEFYHTKNKLNVLLLRIEDSLYYQQDWHEKIQSVADKKSIILQEFTEQIEKQMEQWLDGIKKYTAVAPLVVVTCADSNILTDCSGYEILRNRWLEKLTRTCDSIKNVYQCVSSVTNFNIFDSMRNRMAHIPYNEDGYLYLTIDIVRAFSVLNFSPVKVIVCDCDNTLWQGVVGEDGVNGIRFHKGHLQLQEKLKVCESQGFLICLASKNNEQDILDVFKFRPDILLRLEHITAHRINWLPKSESLRSLAEELNLGLDSFVFIDDNPMEIAEVENELPMVLTLQVKDEEWLQNIPDAFWFTDKIYLSNEDRERTKSYRDGRERSQLRQQQHSLSSFIDSLALKIEIKLIEERDISRIAQLTNKTNQFNLTTLRLNEKEVAAYIGSETKACWIVDVADKFGSYGTVGAMFVCYCNDQWQLNNMLLSCRVLGRGVEYEMLNHLGNMYNGNDRPVRLLFTSSPKNQPAFEFLNAAFLDQDLEKKGKEALHYLEIDSSVLATVTLQDQAICHDESSAQKHVTASIDFNHVVAKQHQFYRHVVESLSTFPDTQRAYNQWFNKKNHGAVDNLKHQTDIADVASDNSNLDANTTWLGISRALRQAIPYYKEKIATETEFESLGLSSLMMVNFTVALSQEFSITLSDTYLYGLRTLGDLQNKLMETLGVAAIALTASSVSPAAGIPKIKPPRRQSSHSSYLADSPKKIAIIGLAGRYPEANTLDKFWQNLSAGVCSVDTVPGDRWNHGDIYSSEPNRPDKSCSREGGFISDHDCFDTGLFQISPKDAALMDPQQRWFLTIAYECVLAAGYSRKNFPQDAGVFVGAMAKDYQILCADLVKKGEAVYPYMDLYQIANRVSYFLNLSGPSMTVDTACSSSGVALHIACESLLQGECSVALAGGVNLILNPQRYIQYTQMGMLSPDSRCRTFADNAQGMVMGEGVGCALLKPLEQAQADGDFIYASLIGTHTNSGGRTSGFTVPNPKAQAQLIKTALKKANISGSDVSYIEAHGTGTPMGDPIEADGIAKALGKRRNVCNLGSVKTNIGHLEPAAAIAGLTKVVLQMRHQTLAPSLHCEQRNHRIDFDRCQLSVQQECQPWHLSPLQNRRIAGVNSFGAGGVNAHVLIEEYRQDEHSDLDAQSCAEFNGVFLVPFSAREPKALRAMVVQFTECLAANQSLPISDISYTLQIGRDEFRHRLVFIASSVTHLLEQMARWLEQAHTDTTSEDIKYFYGDIKRYKEIADVLDSSELLIAQWAQLQDWQKVAAWWVKGALVDWSLCYRYYPERRRVPLPGYPFIGERHWLDGAVYRTETSVIGASPNSNQENIILLQREDYFIADHCVAGQPILPGVSYVAIFAQAYAKQHIRINNLLWLRPLNFAEQQQQCLTLCLSGNGVQLQDASSSTVYAKYHDLTVLDTTEQAPEELNLVDLKSSFTRQLDKADCYQRFRLQGFDYGQRLQAISHIWHDEVRALARVQLPETLVAEPWPLTSALLDAGLQTAICVNDSSQSLLPYACKSVEIYSQHWPSCVYALVDFIQKGDDRLTCSIEFFNEAGQRLLGLSELTLLANTENFAAEYDNQDIYVPVWQDYTRCLDVKCPGEIDLLLCLVPDQITADELQTQLLTSNLSQLQVHKSAYLIKPCEKDVTTYLASLPTLASSRLLVLDYVSASYIDLDDLLPLHVFKSSAMSVRYLLAWVGEQPMGEAYAGLALSLSYETDSRVLKTLSASDRYTLFDRLGEVLYAPEGLQFRVHKNKLQQLSIQSIPLTVDVLSDGLIKETFTTESSLTNSRSSKFQWAHNGTYWFTGLGGIASIVADALITRFNAQIIFTGRRSPSQAEHALAGFPAESVSYYQVDISDAHACEVFWQHRNDESITFDGILHTAGVTADQRLSEQTAISFCQPLHAKIVGTRNVLRILGKTADTWLLMCSSIASVVGNMGQTSYSMANKYLDALAHTEKAAGRMLTINWPLWQDTGMAAETGGDLVEHNRKAGLGILAPARGFELLTTLMQLAVNYHQLIYLPGDKRTLTRMLNRVWNPPALVSAAVPTNTSQAIVKVATNVTFREQLLQVLFQHTYDLLKLPEGILEEDEDLSDYGFDSISLADFSERLNEEFNLSITPVIFFDHPTLGGLADALLNKFVEPIKQALQNTVTGSEVKTLMASESPATGETPAIEAEVANMVCQSHLDRQSYKSVFVSPLSGDNPAPVADSSHTYTLKTMTAEPIAIIGLACRFPQSQSSEDYWQNLLAGANLVGPIPAQRWRPSVGFLQDYPNTVPSAGLIDNIDDFDADFFKLSKREAILMDPQHRLLLELAWQAIEHAGYCPSALSGLPVGVFTAITLHDHMERLQELNQEAIAYLATGNVHCLSANRISFLLNLKGPSEAVDTACSSSLVALNRAIKALRYGECEQALVGGANALLSSTMFEAFTRAGMLSLSGACHTFSANADGYVRGEGGGMLLLKPLKQAQADGDRILALVKGTAVNHVGHGQSLTAPSAKAQAEVIKAALADAQVQASSINYVEAHGTGTRLGDPIEIDGLIQAFAEDPKVSQCFLGTVKTNIGHLESAAGMAGLIKVILAMENRILPASLHSEPHNPYIQLDQTPFRLLSKNQEWKLASVASDVEPLPRRAGVSSFGFGGVNGHVILEEYRHEMRAEITDRQPELVLMSAQRSELLIQQLEHLLKLCEHYSDDELSEIAWVSRHGRKARDYRFAVVVTDIAGLVDVVRQTLVRASEVAGDPSPRIKNYDQAQIEQWREKVQSRQWKSLADLWLSGQKIPWSEVERGKPKKRVNFPLTGFVRSDCGPYQLSNVKGSTAIPIPTSFQDTATPLNTSQLNYWVSHWNNAPLKIQRCADTELQGTILVLVGDSQIINWLPHLPQSPSTRWLIVRADSLLPFVQPHEYEINDDLTALKPHLNQVNYILDAFDLLPMICNANLGSSSLETLLRHWSQRVNLLQQVIRQRAGKPLQLIHASNEKTDPTGAWMGCLYGGLSAEYDSVHSYRLVFTDMPTIARVHEIISAEQMAVELKDEDLSGGSFRYEGNLRQRLEWISFKLSQSESSAAQFSPIQAKHCYLITGGRGKIALQMANLLVREGASYILLLGRAPLSEDNQHDINLLTKQGAEVVYFQDLVTVESWLASRRQCVKGVFHCAGIDTQGELAFINKQSEAFVQCLTPKLYLAESLCQMLDKACPEGRGGLDFFIAFSSVAAVAPSLTAGRSDYGPANAALDKWIEIQSEHYPDAGFFSLRWPSHEQGGMPVVASSVYEGTGLPHLNKSQTAQLTMAAIRKQVTQSQDDMPSLLLPVGDEMSELSLSPPYVRAGAKTQVDSIRLPDNANVKHAGKGGQQQRVVRALQDLFAERLLISTPISPVQSFTHMGVDSILVADLVIAIERRFNCVLPPYAILEYPNLNNLSEYLVAEQGVILEENLLLVGAQNSTEQQSLVSPSSPERAPASNFTEPLGKPSQTDKIAVIGMACRFPGAATVEAFWHNLKTGQSDVVQVPRQRFDLQSLFDSDPKAGQSASQWAGLIEGVDLFDPEYFGIQATQAQFIDPLTRLSLLTSAEAIANAGYSKKDIWGSNTGVFMGGNRAHYGLPNVAHPAAATGMNQNFIASHLSHVYNLTGPSFVVDSACSSSLLSIHLARQQLLAGDIDIAVAGGSEVLLDETPFVKLTASGALSPDGKCHTFAADANGFVPGEGAGAVVLKRLSDAIEDRDPIYGVIESSSVNNDGNTMGLTTPNIEAQKALLQKVYGDGQLPIEELAYWEAHGTATMIGDPIELKAISTVLRACGARSGQVAIGSVKSNFGHLMGAAGVASFIKTILVLHNQQIVPTLNCRRANPRFRFDESPIHPATTSQPLNMYQGRALAGMSAFGFGGTNCHICCSTYFTDNKQILRQRLPLPVFNLKPFWLSSQRQLARPEFTEIPLSPSQTQPLKRQSVKQAKSERRPILALEVI